MQNLVNIKINNIPVSVPAGTTILDAARKIGVEIPTLCYLREINEIGACRICVVEVVGMRNLVTACVYPVAEGMDIVTNSQKVLSSRKTTLELILSDHNKDCLSCLRSSKCELQRLARDYRCDSNKYEGKHSAYTIDRSAQWLIRDDNKCILCRKCTAVCAKVQEVAVIGANGRGFDTHISCAFETSVANNPCVACGQCINVCPTGALREKTEYKQVLDAIADPKKHVIFGTAPSVRVALGEEFGYKFGSDVEGKMVAAIRRLGADKVFDVDVTADLTIVEEGYEFLGRLGNPEAKLPMITSCSPGWIRYIEFYYPELLPHLSSCKSPQQMFGALCKTYYAQKFNIDPKDIYVVSVMPCVAKKYEKTREHQNAAGVPDIDAVLTTRELARIIKTSGILFDELEDSAFDAPMGIASGAGLLFGSSGGVMEAALRTVAEKVNGKPLDAIDFNEVRGHEGIKEAEYWIGGKIVKVCVASGIKNAKVVLEKIKNGEADYHFIEIMTCPGGCINGGGQPTVKSYVHNFIDFKKMRAQAIYSKDKSMKLRKSHESPVVQELYREYFGEPNSHKAHEILHTEYKAKPKYK